MSKSHVRQVAQLISGAPIGNLTPMSTRYAKDECGRVFRYTQLERYEAGKRRRQYARDKRAFSFGHMRNMRDITGNLSNKYCGYVLLLQPYIAFNTGLLAANDRDNTPLKVADIARIWDVSARTAKSVLAELERRSIVFENDGQYSINERYHFRKKTGGEVDALIKTYFTPLRDFKLSAADLGFVYKLLPYVHYETNTVCADPFANAEDIRFLNEKEIAAEIGMDEKETVKILARLRKAGILRGYVNADNRKDTLTILNPYVFYRKQGEPDSLVLALFNQPSKK